MIKCLFFILISFLIYLLYLLIPETEKSGYCTLMVLWVPAHMLFGGGVGGVAIGWSPKTSSRSSFVMYYQIWTLVSDYVLKYSDQMNPPMITMETLERWLGVRIICHEKASF